MRIFITFLLNLLLLFPIYGQQTNNETIKFSSQLGIIPFNLGFNTSNFYHVNKNNALGFEVNSFISEPDLKKPATNGFGPNLPFSSYTEISNNYLLKYVYYPSQKEPSYFQIGFSTAIGIHEFKRVTGYNKSTSGGTFFSSTSYHEIYEINGFASYQFGFQLLKRKKALSYFMSFDMQISKYKTKPLLKTGLQINIFKKERNPFRS